MFVADREFAVRMEQMVKDETVGFAALAKELFPDTRAVVEQFGEGLALYGGEEILFNEIVGFGTQGTPVPADLDAMASFYDEHRSASTVLLPSLADPASIPLFERRGWMPSGFEDVFVLPMEDRAAVACVESTWAGIDIRVVRPVEREAWGRCVAEGFATDAPTDIELRSARIFAARRDSILAWVWIGGKPVATGELFISRGVGWLSADATLPEYRGRGIQQALQRYRVAMARDRGCELAVTEATPGTVSHRNIQRVGFRLAYTRLLMERPPSNG